MKWCPMRIPLIMPDLGVAQMTLSIWFVANGSNVLEGDRLLEVLTGPATFDLSAPATGRLVERTVFVNDRVFPGQTLGFIEES